MSSPSKALSDPLFGDLIYDYGWLGKFPISFFGERIEIQLSVRCDEGSAIEPIQRDAFSRFREQADLRVQTAVHAIFSHYQAECKDLRARFGAFADEWAPVIETEQEIGRTIQLTELFIPYSFHEGERVVGLLFSCTWEQELGFAAKFVDEELVEIGPQDIVL